MSPTLAAAADLFLLASNYSPASLNNYRIFLRRTLPSFIASDRPVHLISFDDLVRFLTYCREERGVVCLTLRHYTGFLRQFFGWCVDVGYIERSPAAALKSPRCPDQRIVRGVPVTHLRRMLDYTEQANRRNYAILLFMAVTGCRVSATSALTLENLDIDNKRALVYEKGGRWVVYEFDQMTASALSGWLMERPAVGHHFVWTGPGPDYLQLQATGIRKMLYDLCRRLRLPHYTPHQLRHSAGEILASNDHSELSVASALNHKNPQSARIYMPKRLPHTRHLRREIEEALYPERADVQSK